MKNANPVCGRWGAVAVVFGVWLLTACGPATSAPTTEPKTVNDWFAIKVGAASIDMQLAVRAAEMQKGLMGRTDLQDNQGMLFVYRTAQQMSFWMRGTPTALDIGYFSSDGVLREVYPLYPYDETPVPSLRTDIQYALELKQGGFAKLGLKLGDKIDLQALKQALKERDFDVRQFEGLPE